MRYYIISQEDEPYQTNNEQAALEAAKDTTSIVIDSAVGSQICEDGTKMPLLECNKVPNIS